MLDIQVLIKEVALMKSRIIEIEQILAEHQGEFAQQNTQELLLKMLTKSGSKGLTIRELGRNSRQLDKLNNEAIEAHLNALIAQSKVFLVEMPSQSGRGRKRGAYVLNNSN